MLPTENINPPIPVPVPISSFIMLQNNAGGTATPKIRACKRKKRLCFEAIRIFHALSRGEKPVGRFGRMSLWCLGSRSPSPSMSTSTTFGAGVFHRSPTNGQRFGDGGSPSSASPTKMPHPLRRDLHSRPITTTDLKLNDVRTTQRRGRINWLRHRRRRRRIQAFPTAVCSNLNITHAFYTHPKILVLATIIK
jgi:hypothetical protein